MKRQNGVYHTIDKILCLLHLILGKSANHLSINIERLGTFHTYSKSATDVAPCYVCGGLAVPNDHRPMLS